ncbi:MAG: hypothetical protein CL927_17830 [Deltaproteobacteria bacterium]|nr:hypothetical protein [Deltaproteobacteria bacterium]HCH61292.1 hypothetical protein [Deltaproteobacteria bacterium]
MDLPHGRIVVFRGPSGSGKSSLALDVLHAESRRRLLEVLRVPGTGARTLPSVPVDRIAGLPPTIAVAPDDTVRADRSLSEFTDLGTILRSVFAQRGMLLDPQTHQPLEAWNTARVVEALAQLPEGSRLTIGAPLRPFDSPERGLNELRRSGFVRVRLGSRITRLDELERLPAGVAVELIVDRIKWSPTRQDRLTEAVDTAWTAGGGRVRVELGGTDRTSREFGRLRKSADGTVWPKATPDHFDRSRPEGRCQACTGEGCASCDNTGRSDLARHTHLHGHTIETVYALSLTALSRWLYAHPDLPDRLRTMVDSFVALGLGSLTPAQSQKSLGRGEWRRAALGRAIHLAEPPNLLILDEPLSGLSTEQVTSVLRVLQQVNEQGSSILVIEHRPEILAIAHQVFDFGPGSGPDGGRVTESSTLSQADGWARPVSRSGASEPTWTACHPRAATSLSLCANIWTVLTGPSGAGSTSLAVHALAAHFAGRVLVEGCQVTGPEPRLIEPTHLAGTGNARSCVATAAGVWTHLRTLLTSTRAARVRGLGAEAFTFNRATGWCPECEGRGELAQRFGPLPPILTPCPTCGGSRFRPDIDDVRWKGHSPAQLLGLNVEAARVLFAANPRLSPVLEAMAAVGLGYLPLGRSTASLSSGERRRFGIAVALARLKAAARDPRPTLVVLDQPDAGLDDATAAQVAQWLSAAAQGRATLLTVAHHPALLAAADAVVPIPYT